MADRNASFPVGVSIATITESSMSSELVSALGERELSVGSSMSQAINCNSRFFAHPCILVVYTETASLRQVYTILELSTEMASVWVLFTDRL